MNFADLSSGSALVTGGTGFVGRWLVETLRKLGSRVTVLAREPGSARHPIPEGVEIVYGPLRDFRFLSELFSAHKIDTVFHLAAQPLVDVARELPRETLETNVEGTWHVLEAIRFSGVRKIILASSHKASAYLGQSASGPLDPYSASKVCAELVAASYAATFGLRVAIARFPNLYGGGDLNFSRLVPDLIRSTLNGEPVVIRSDGNARLNLLYVKDAVKALLLLADRLDSDSTISGRAFNFGEETEVSVLEAAAVILRLMDRPDLRPVVTGTGSGDRTAPKFDSAAARELLGWVPCYSLEDGLSESIAWYRSHLADTSHATLASHAMASHGMR